MYNECRFCSWLSLFQKLVQIYLIVLEILLSILSYVTFVTNIFIDFQISVTTGLSNSLWSLNKNLEIGSF